MCQFKEISSYHTSGQPRKGIIMYIYTFVSRHIIEAIILIHEMLYTALADMLKHMQHATLCILLHVEGIVSCMLG